MLGFGGHARRLGIGMALVTPNLHKFTIPALPLAGQYNTPLFGFLGTTRLPQASKSSLGQMRPSLVDLPSPGLHIQQQVRSMNRNARRPKRANHGKRPVSHARKREKQKNEKEGRQG